MSYQLLPQNGDSLQVPQLVLNNLNNAREDYVRVALYVLYTQDTEPASIAAALNLKNEASAQKALAFWQGAGLLREETGAVPAAELRRRPPRLTTREVLQHSGRNPEIAVLMQEAQRIFGEVISESGCNTLATMYVSDGMPLDYLLIGLASFASQGFTSKKLGTIQHRMENWQEQGVRTASQLDAHLEMLRARCAHHTEAARLLGVPEESITVSEWTRVDLWYEQYHYTEPMISMAVGMVGDSEKKTVAYITGILKKWNAKGFRQPRDVLASQQGSNAAPAGRSAQPQNDLLQKKKGWVPKFRLEDD